MVVGPQGIDAILPCMEFVIVKMRPDHMAKQIFQVTIIIAAIGNVHLPPPNLLCAPNFHKGLLKCVSSRTNASIKTTGSNHSVD